MDELLFDRGLLQVFIEAEKTKEEDLLKLLDAWSSQGLHDD